MISEKVKWFFDKSVDIVFSVILLFIIIGIAVGTVQLFITTWELFHFKGITGHYINIIADVLTLYVLIELSRSLVEYFVSQKLRLTFILDGVIVFILRDVMMVVSIFLCEIIPCHFLQERQVLSHFPNRV